MKEELIKEELLDNNKVILRTYKDTFPNGFVFYKKEIVLPHISKEELLSRYRNIKPIVYYDNDFHYLKRYNSKMMRTESFVSNFEKDVRNTVNMYGYKVLDEFTCYHEFNDMYEFTPTIAEVLEQYPDYLLEYSNAFCLTRCIKLINTEKDVLQAGYHKSKVKALILK